MILSSLRIQWISDEKGYGLFATQFIPKGTITFVQDSFDIVVPQTSFQGLEPRFKVLADKYSYENSFGDRIISWDLGKYMNHCCHANTLSTGYGFEIAIRDIEPGEEVTDDYRMFTTDHKMTFECGKEFCENSIDIDNRSALVRAWDKKIKAALNFLTKVPQELSEYLSESDFKNLHSYLQGCTNYTSISAQLPSVTPSKKPEACEALNK